MKSVLGTLPIRKQQAQRLGLDAYARLSPLLEKCALRVAACQSYQNGATEVAIMTGMKVSHSTLQRLVQRHDVSLPEAKQTVTELSVDGGKVRLRSAVKGEPSHWLEYKSVRIENLYYGAAFQQNEWLQDWLNSQSLVQPVVCLGDGHSGVWAFLRPVATAETRLEILDWYHLVENLYKVGGSLTRLKQAKALLWEGRVDEAKALFEDCSLDQARRFCEYLERHRHRIVNYCYYQAEQICSIGSGAVESSIKQIDYRMKLAGAQWSPANVQQALQVRCAYLNGAYDC